VKPRAAGYIGVCLAVPLCASALAQSTATAPRDAAPSADTLAAPSSETLDITASQALTWSQDGAIVMQLSGPLRIEVGGAVLQADSGVIWLSEVETGVFDARRAQIALIGNASIERNGATRTGPNLIATATIRDRVRITANERFSRDASQSELYRTADALRRESAAAAVDQTAPTRAVATTRPAAPVAPETIITPALEPVSIQAGNADTPGDDQRPAGQKVYTALTGDVLLIQRRANGDLIELQAQRAVLFTQLNSLRELEQGERFKRIEDAVESAYLEGDVRVIYTPAGGGAGEQRLRADRVFYEFTTDRAILTDAVLHATDPRRPVPVFVRAQTIRQLSLEEYSAEKVQLTTSAFHTPSYAIAADRAYVRRSESDARGTRYDFTGNDSTLQTFGTPVFYFPYVSGSITERGTPLRNLNFGNNGRFGTFVQTDWGLFETLGKTPPDNLDIVYKLDYYSDRGPGGGVDASYGGGFIRETTRQPWTFEGDFTSFFVYDRGEDDLGGSRADVEPEDEFRGRALWEHQHFFPEDWQLQLRAGWVSDPTFLEQWFERDWDRNREHDLSAYIKRQRDSEAITFLVDVQPNEFVTTSDWAQEQFEVERLPEVGYHRIGDSFGDTATFFSSNSVSALQFEESEATLAEQGYFFGVQPGLPSVGQTGIDGGTNIRGDFRQEVDFPIKLDQVRMVPYVMGRYTGYTDTPGGGSENRFMGGLGVRLTTTFWNVDDTVESKLFDLHRLRHVVEPEVHLFTSAASADATDLFIYDEDVDRVADLSGASIGLRQRWQTKRGGPGKWRSVDFFTLNTFANFFSNKPDEIFQNPEQFRGQYYWSLPEASIARNSLNADATWRIADSTAILADASYNLDENELATAAVGLAVRRADRVSYFVGLRYIEPVDANLLTLAATYQVSTRYTLAGSTSFGIGDDDRVYASGSIQRHFDRFTTVVSIYYDEVDDLGGLNVSIIPHGLAGAIGSGDPARALGGGGFR
jgi:lipopolysaccharide assembly outer membrane protein LptD (OstA)